jgi:iron(III) transport system substrate-binding protein
MRISRFFKSLALTGLVAFAAAPSAQKTQLLVYTALETDQLKAYQEGFNKVEPNIEIKWVRDSTGVITAKLLAEKANPQADVMGVAASSLALLDKNGMLEPYAPLNLDAIMSQYRDKKNPPAWFGMDVWGATVCFNTVEAKKKNIPKPETWKDLTQARLQGPGRDAQPGVVGHRLLRRHRLAARCGATTTARAAAGSTWTACTRTSRSTRTRGSKPCNMAAAGEYVVGISFEYRANSNKAKGAPIDLVFPKEGLGWDLEAFAIHKGTKKLDAAKKLADWAAARTRCCCTARTSPSPRSPASRAAGQRARDYEARLVKMDFNWAAEQPRAHPGRVDQALQRQVRKALPRAESPPPRGATPAAPRAGSAACWNKPRLLHRLP